jgi:hypothetical protein
VNNTREGRGMYLYANGDVYEGDWMNGKKHGRGVETIKGVKQEVRYENGVEVFPVK